MGALEVGGFSYSPGGEDGGMASLINRVGGGCEAGEKVIVEEIA